MLKKYLALSTYMIAVFSLTDNVVPNDILVSFRSAVHQKCWYSHLGSKAFGLEESPRKVLGFHFQTFLFN